MSLFKSLELRSPSSWASSSRSFSSWSRSARRCWCASCSSQRISYAARFTFCTASSVECYLGAAGTPLVAAGAGAGVRRGVALSLRLGVGGTNSRPSAAARSRVFQIAMSGTITFKPLEFALKSCDSGAENRPPNPAAYALIIKSARRRSPASPRIESDSFLSQSVLDF